MSESVFFDVRAISALAPDRLYRVFVAGSDLCFVQIGGQGGMDGATIARAALIGGFGLVGGLVGDAIAKRAEERREASIPEGPKGDPRALARMGKNNFVAAVTDFIKSALEPAPQLAAHGKCHGRWNVHLRGERKFTFQFERLADMKVAVETLPPLLGRRLVVAVKWNEQTQQYVKTGS